MVQFDRSKILNGAYILLPYKKNSRYPGILPGDIHGKFSLGQRNVGKSAKM